MAGTLVDIRTRISSELRRSNINSDIDNAVNDAIAEGAKQRFYFNEMHLTFPTVAGQEYYPDLGLVELDAAWYLNGNQQMPVNTINQLDANMFFGSSGSGGGQLELIARYGGQLRLYPIPSSIVTIHVDGFGKLTPNPLVLDTDGNAWLTEGETYIRALAKRNVVRDVIRYKAQLVEITTLKSTDNTLRSTQF
jgi:hypothetical protein